jgi:hypothetical protein
VQPVDHLFAVLLDDRDSFGSFDIEFDFVEVLRECGAFEEDFAVLSECDTVLVECDFCALVASCPVDRRFAKPGR